ncbi:leukocyte receptor cluster (LRC) member 9 L homeolog [Xenopus laevis]|uniref:Leukocyte receptor cluster (LRC) member 9 L homeolog n=1 Tax=Xenopus laevis TaxID=8355 RepID=Q66KM9_XENLA|nr:leukocyte receptor cluster (LRC) member 9 L homeolog [Xenopus laevis]AAH78625.1 MGC85593 protein [Xenopus laevis]
MEDTGTSQDVPNGDTNSEVDPPHSESETDPLTNSSGTSAEGVPCQFFLLGRCRFGERCRNVHPESLQNSQPESKAKTKEKRSEPNAKKPPMKTAADVISRIQWDPNLPKEHFLIGYLDRFLGIIEKPYSAFCWEDLASVGHDVLAIPKHRIQYFKYQRLVVWDKTSRTDNVFGSTGSGLTILDIIDQYEALAPEQPETANPDEAISPDTEDTETRNDFGASERSNDIDENDGKSRPTHFVAVRISSDDVRNAVKEIQNVLLGNNPELEEFCVPVQTLHLTLCLLYLESAEDIESALLTLQELKHEMQRTLPPSLILSFEGVRDFHSRVLYLAPSAVPALEKFTHDLQKSFRSKGLRVVDSQRSSIFHVTIAKIPMKVLRKQPNLAFSPQVYNTTPVTHFGAQHVDSLSFCYAGSTRRTDGFYTTLLELNLY